MEEKKITRKQLEEEELSNVNGGSGSVVPNLESTVATAKPSIGVHAAAVNEADAIRKAVPVPGKVSTPHTLIDEASHGPKWKGNDL